MVSREMDWSMHYCHHKALVIRGGRLTNQKALSQYFYARIVLISLDKGLDKGLNLVCSSLGCDYIGRDRVSAGSLANVRNEVDEGISWLSVKGHTWTAWREKWPRSENMDSQPVTHRNIPPRLTHAFLPSFTRYLYKAKIHQNLHNVTSGF